MPSLKLKPLLLIYFAALAYVFGSSYTIFVNHDASFSSDEQSYLKMAKGNYHVETTHRYRVVVPVLASATAQAIGQVFQLFRPGSEEVKLPLGSGFFLVNALLMAFAGLFIFQVCLLYGASGFASFIAMTAVLTSAYTGYFTGIALTDSLYLLIFALTLYGIKAQSPAALVFCIFIGPLAKESFVFLAPVIFLFGYRAIPRLYQVALFLLSGLVTFGIRHLIDQKIGFTAEAGLDNAFHHFYNVGPTLQKLMSLKGLISLWSTYGFFYLLVLTGFTGGKKARGKWMHRLDKTVMGVIFVVLVHIPLSGEIGRMAYFAAPAFAVVLSLVITYHPFFATIFPDLSPPKDKKL